MSIAVLLIFEKSRFEAHGCRRCPSGRVGGLLRSTCCNIRRSPWLHLSSTTWCSAAALPRLPLPCALCGGLSWSLARGRWRLQLPRLWIPPWCGRRRRCLEGLLRWCKDDAKTARLIHGDCLGHRQFARAISSDRNAPSLPFLPINPYYHH